MPNLSFNILEAHEFIRLGHRASKLEGALLAENAKIKNQSVVLEDETCELEATNETIRVRVTHVFI